MFRRFCSFAVANQKLRLSKQRWRRLDAERRYLRVEYRAQYAAVMADTPLLRFTFTFTHSAGDGKLVMKLMDALEIPNIAESTTKSIA
jgi:hypothetical protein